MLSLKCKSDLLLMDCVSDANPSPTKQRFYQVLMGLILFMFLIETIHISVNVYQLWLAFVQYAESPDESIVILKLAASTPSLLAIGAIDDMLTTFRLAIADSIMVSPSMLLSMLLSANNTYV